MGALNRDKVTQWVILGLLLAGMILIAMLQRPPLEPRYPLRASHSTWGSFGLKQQWIDVHFTHPVNAGDLERYLEIRNGLDGNAVAPYEILTAGASAVHRLATKLEVTEDVELLIRIARGLPGPEGIQPLPSEWTYTLRRRAQTLIAEDFHWNPSHREGLALQVNLSASVDAADLRNHLDVHPALENMRVIPGRYTGDFAILGEWRPNETYEVTLAAGLVYAGGLISKKSLTRSVTPPEIPPYVGFGRAREYYFPRRGALELPLSHRNATHVTLRLGRMFPSNIAVALEDLRKGEGSGTFMERWSESLEETELNLGESTYRLVETPLDLGALLPADKRGVFCIEARSVGDESASDRKIILVTDIGVLAHWQRNELVLFSHDLYSLKPLAGAVVHLYSKKNQVVSRGQTDGSGVCRLAAFSPELGEPYVAVVEHGNDYTFLDLSSSVKDAVPFTSAMPAYDGEGYQGFVYGDRELYRPGETVRLRWLVRTGGGEGVAGVPLILTVTNPNGRELLSRPVTLSAFGTGDLDVPTQKSYPTGRYSARLSVPGSKKHIADYPFHLEEFVPNRIRVSLTPAESPLIAGRETSIELAAEHLFGAPAAERKAEVEVLLRKKGVELSRWQGFQFDNGETFTPKAVPCGEQRTDAEGRAVFSFQHTPEDALRFPVEAVILGRVFELGGRAVTAKAETVFFPSEIALGIRGESLGKDGIAVQAAAVRPDESPADIHRVKVTLERQVWNYYVRRYYTHHQPSWGKSFEPVETREVDLRDGMGETTFRPVGYGYYRVRVHSDDTPQFSALSFYAYDGSCEIEDSARPSLIQVSLDRKDYVAGEEAEVHIESPFGGMGVVVVQGERFHRVLPVEIADKRARVRFRIEKEYFPNVWVHATVIHSFEKDRVAVHPFSSFAAAPLSVRDPDRRLEVSWEEPPAEVRPAEPLEIAVTVRDQAGKPVEAELTVAAVDEGIHAILGTRDPDPYAWLLRLRRPDHNRAHYYDKVAYDFSSPEPSGDGEAEEEIAKRVDSSDTNWIRPVALWSGVVQTDRHGRAAIRLDVPEFTGALRLAAVACTPEAVGAAGGQVLVRRPYMLRTSMPRFLLPDDHARCRAVVFNHSDAPVTAVLSWSSGGVLSSGEGSETLFLPPGREQSVWADVAAGPLMGQGEIRWELTVTGEAGDVLEELTEIAPIPVRPAAGFQSHHELVTLAPGERRVLRNTRFVDDDRTEMEVSMAATPLIRLEKALQFVVGYPYGCLEQVTSRLLPMYLLRKNRALTASAAPGSADLNEYLRHSIDRLFSMQTDSGGLGMWPGSYYAYDYGSVYALHFLTLAKQGREFEPPKKNMKALQDYVRNIAMTHPSEQPWDLYLRAYALYVLVLDGDLKAIRQIGRFDKILMPRPARFLLAAALAHSTGDARRVKEYLSKAPSETYRTRTQGGTLESDIRNLAVEVTALRQMNADPVEIAPKADLLIRFLEERHYGTTQETALVITALAGYLEDFAGGPAQASAVVEGPRETVNVTGTDYYRSAHKGPGTTYTVHNTGSAAMWMYVTTKGILLEPETQAESRGVSIRRELLSAESGKVTTDPVFEHGRTYLGRLTLRCDVGVANLVVTDLLPAGFEIENPRVDPDALPGGSLPGAVTPSYLEIRDDRLVLAFNELRSGTHTFYYVVRAVTPGRYRYPAPQAECMYDPAVGGRGETGSIEVRAE